MHVGAIVFMMGQDTSANNNNITSSTTTYAEAWAVLLMILTPIMWQHVLYVKYTVWTVHSHVICGEEMPPKGQVAIH